MTIQINLNKIVGFGLLALTTTCLSFATIVTIKFAVAEAVEERSVSPDVIDEGMNGTWDLRWKVSGWLHEARLKMDGNSGTMIVSASGPNGKTVRAEQQMTMVLNQEGYILKGRNPTYPGTDQRNDNYQPDTFFVESNRRGDWEMENCSNSSNCAPVKMTIIDR